MNDAMIHPKKIPGYFDCALSFDWADIAIISMTTPKTTMQMPDQILMLMPSECR